MNSGFRRYNFTGNGPEKKPGGATAPPEAATSNETTHPAKKTSPYDKQNNLFSEMRQYMIGYMAQGTGSAVAVFDYGYFGGDVEEYKGSGGGSSAGGGSKLTSDSRQAPSPFSSIFGGS